MKAFPAAILIVDDVAANRNLLAATLEPEGYEVLFAGDGESALKTAAAQHPDLILLDVLMPGLDGFETCRRLKAEAATQSIPVIFITAQHETRNVVAGLRAGGVDYVTKAFEAEEILARVETQLTIHRLTAELRRKHGELTEEMQRREQAEASLERADEHLSWVTQREAERWGLAGFVGQSEALRRILEEIRDAQSVATTGVLILGESGTGKELVARAIHFGGLRAKEPFLPVNCTAIPEQLAESLLFGHVKGAFSGAQKDQKGYFELADGGTLFLDEIGDMTPALQPKLLRVLETGVILPIGATREKQLNVRVLAATNADIKGKISAGRFRADLYHRLARFEVRVPPLRERPDDIPLLAAHFLKILSTEMNRPIPTLGMEAMAMLQEHPWPGNIRELRNVLERALLKSRGKTILVEHLGLDSELVAPKRPGPGSESVGVPLSTLNDLPMNLEEAKRALMRRALAQADGNMSKAAELLGVNRAKLYRALAGEDTAPD